MTLITNPVRNGRIWTAVIALLWVFIGAFASFPEELGNFEGRLMPVVRDLRIVEISDTPDGPTVIRAEAHKARRCAFRQVSWGLVGKDGLETAVGVVNSEIQRLNDVGPIRTGPWHIYAPRAEILARGYAVMIHRCHPFFLTRTPVYAGDAVR